jgi:hypothetical protein
VPLTRDNWFKIEHDEVFSEGALLVGSIEPLMEFQPRGATGPQRQRVDNATGLPLFGALVTDLAATSKNQASQVVEIAAKHQPVPPEGGRLRLVEFEGLRVQPRLEGQGEFRRLGWTMRADGLRAAGNNSPAGNTGGSKPAASRPTDAKSGEKVA